MFNRRKGWKLWTGLTLVGVPGVLGFIATIWPAFSNKTIPEWAEAHGYPMTAEFMAWVVLGCVVIGLVFVLWFIFSPEEKAGTPSPLSISMDEFLIRKHGIQYAPLRVHNGDPAKSAIGFKVEITGFGKGPKWLGGDLPFLLPTTNKEVSHINPGSSELVDFLRISKAQNHAGGVITENFYMSLETLQKRTRSLDSHTLGLCIEKPMLVGDEFSFTVCVTAQDFSPLVGEILCKISPDGQNEFLRATFRKKK